MTRLALVAGCCLLVAGCGERHESKSVTTTPRLTTKVVPGTPTATAPKPPVAPIGRWTSEPDAPTRRTEVSAARVGADAYVVGGFTSDARSSALVQRLDLRTGRWSAAPALPATRNHASTASYDGAVYVFGGYGSPTDTSSGATSTLWRLAPGGRRWQPMPAAPVARAAAGAAVLDDKLYVAGGRNEQTTTMDSLSIYDFTTKTWSSGPALHHAREHVAAVAAGGAIYVLGGRALGQGDFADVERYVPGARSWQQLAPMPIARAGFQAVALGTQIVVVGGEDSGGTIGRVDVLDTTTGHWSTAPALPTPRHGIGLVAWDAIVWAIDGGPQPGLTTAATVERLRLH